MKPDLDMSQYGVIRRALRHERRRRKLSIANLADRLGVGDATMAGWELGRHSPSPTDLCRWAASLDMIVVLTEGDLLPGRP